MSISAQINRLAACACGNVEIQALGVPITTVACYCEDCQEAARQIAALPNSMGIRDPDGGTSYVANRKDRIKLSKGADLLRNHKIKQRSVTNRV